MRESQGHLPRLVLRLERLRTTVLGVPLIQLITSKLLLVESGKAISSSLHHGGSMLQKRAFQHCYCEYIVAFLAGGHRDFSLDSVLDWHCC